MPRKVEAVKGTPFPKHLSKNAIQQRITVIIPSGALLSVVREPVNFKIRTVLNWATVAWWTKTASPTNVERKKHSVHALI
mmetsp:Transcript_62807/g.73457  ORF Transcript_62807/g.73457 Transcript_62807/m.73457 type:complete len:80 (+) Transcript_62807:35-274(+)